MKIESILFDYISETNKFLNFYIDKSYKVATIFHKEILPSDFFYMKILYFLLNFQM